MNTKENWIEETLNALDDIQSVEVPMALNYSLQNYIKQKEIRFSSTQIWMIAASVIVLLSINLISITYYSKKNDKLSSNESQNLVYKEYFSSDY